MIDMQAMVKEFHVKMGLPCPDKPQKAAPEMALLRLRLINEEWGETCESLYKMSLPWRLKMLPEIADGLADLLYVIFGSGVSCGIPLIQVNWTTTSRISEPKLEDVVQHILSVSTQIGNVAVALHQDDASLGPELSTLAVSVGSLANRLTLPMEEIFTEVHRSNMTKTPLDEHRKGGKGTGFEPPNIEAILTRYGWQRVG